MREQEIIGMNIQAIRAEKGLKQRAVAEAAHISTPQLSAYENGRKMPSLTTLANIAQALGVNIDTLYYGDEDRAFINRASSRGRAIVNSIFKLWEEGAIGGVKEIEVDSYAKRTAIGAFFTRYDGSLLRLSNLVADFLERKETFADPEAYLEQLLASAAKEIDNQIQAKGY